MMYPTPLSSTTVVGSRSSSSTRAIVSPVSSGRPSVTITLNCLPCSTAQRSKAGQGRTGQVGRGMSRAENWVASLATGTPELKQRTAACVMHSPTTESPLPAGLSADPPACLPAATHRRRRLAQHRYHHPRVAVAQHCGALANEALPELCYRRPRPLGCLCTRGSSGETSPSLSSNLGCCLLRSAAEGIDPLPVLG